MTKIYECEDENIPVKEALGLTDFIQEKSFTVGCGETYTFEF